MNLFFAVFHLLKNDVYVSWSKFIIKTTAAYVHANEQLRFSFFVLVRYSFCSASSR